MLSLPKKMLALLLVSIAAGTLLLVSVYALPVDAIRENVKASINALLKEGVRNSWAAFTYTRPSRHMSDNLSFKSLIKTARPYAIADGFTDGIMLNNAIYKGTNPLHDAMNIPNLSFGAGEDELGDPVLNLSKALDGSTHGKSVVRNYSRYWHGYLVYLKPLLMLMSVSCIRVLNLVLQFMMFALIIAKMTAATGAAYSLAFTLAVLVIDPISTVLSLQYSDVYCLVLIMFIVMLSHNDKLRENGRYYLLFMFAGILTAYLDLLTYPSTVLGMSTVLYLLLNNDLTLGRKITDMIKLGLSWGLGYGGMWSSKWVLSWLITGNNTVLDALLSMVDRTSGGIYGLTLSWSWLFGHLGRVFILLGFIAAVIMIIVWLSVRKKRTSFGEVVPLLLASLYPFVWYATLKQHSFIHYFFTHKNLAVTVFALVCVFAKCAGCSSSKETLCTK